MSPNYHKSAPSHTIKVVREIMRPLTGWTHFCVVRKTVLPNCLPLACDIYGYPAIYPQLLKKIFLTFFKFPHEKWSYLVDMEKNVEELLLLGWLSVGTLCLQSVLRESDQQFQWQHIIPLSGGTCSLRSIFSLSEWPICCLFIISISYRNQNWKKKTLKLKQVICGQSNEVSCQKNPPNKQKRKPKKQRLTVLRIKLWFQSIIAAV